LVNELLDLSRLEAGQVELTPLPLDLKPLLQEVAASLQSQMQARRQQFRLVLPSQLPPVLGDSTRLVQIFTNLVANANKYTPEGGRITVTAQVVAGAIAVDVDDTGIGLTEEDQSRLFTKFFRAKNQLTQESGGTGLGLAITRALVERHGGTITVTKHARRRFDIPRAPACCTARMVARRLTVCPLSRRLR